MWVRGSDEPLFDSDSPIPWLFSYAVAFGLLGWFYSSYRMAQRAREWPVAHGSVVSTAAEVDEGTTTIEIAYEFQVGGVTHRGRRLRFGGGPYYRQRTVDAILARYPKGAQVQVLYDPAKPDNCALESSFEWLGWSPVIVFALAILMTTTYQLLH
jgi:hypothetical protein